MDNSKVIDLRDSSTWSSPPLLLLRDIQSNLLTHYDSKESCTPSQSHLVEVQTLEGLEGGVRLVTGDFESWSELQVRHGTGPIPVSPVPVLAGEVAHRYRL
jgi:hypothetical protein